ncbi:MAG: hypothetical protein PHU14_09300 [Methylovulum sp.]|nr:hypothetical protein [Methylovulum sp.]
MQQQQQGDGLIPCKVMSPLKSGGKKYAVGAVVELPGDEVIRLWELGVIAEPAPLVTAPEATDQGKPEALAEGQSEQPPEAADQGNPEQPPEAVDAAGGA